MPWQQQAAEQGRGRTSAGLEGVHGVVGVDKTALVQHVGGQGLGATQNFGEHQMCNKKLWLLAKKGEMFMKQQFGTEASQLAISPGLMIGAAQVLRL